MNKTLFASSVILSLTLFGQAAFASNAKEISKEDLAAIAQDYLMEYTEQAQPRRSALFAHILDTLTQNSTMAKADVTITTPALLMDLDDALVKSAVL